MSRRQNPRPVRDLTHAYKTKSGAYVLVVENRLSSRAPGAIDIYIGAEGALEHYPATKCDMARDGTHSFHIANGPHPTYVFFPPLTARAKARISRHHETDGPLVEDIFHAEIDKIIGKLGDFDALDIDLISPQPRVG